MILCWVWTLPNAGRLEYKLIVTNLYEWSIKWGMLFNPDKCMHMEVGRDAPAFKLFMNDIAIPQTSSLKYLGVYIQSDLKAHTKCCKQK